VSNSSDNDDWSNDSASLFREARRAHDPTPAESARLAAVLTRVQAANAEASMAENRGADIAARGVTSAVRRQVASVSLGIVCIAAASFAFMRLNRHPSEPARSARPIPNAVASTPPPIAVQPAPVLPNGELSTSAQTSAARDEAQLRPRSQRRRSRAIAERQQSSRIETASVPEASSAAPLDSSASVTVPKNGAAAQERSGSGSTVKAAAAIQQAAPRATSSESGSQEAVTAAARKADPALPQAAPTELALMKRIQHALRDADFSTVLALCVEHARRWPHGVFELEREGVRAIAACGGNSDDAALQANRFLKAHPHAPVAMRVSTACAAHLIKR
jgi:hypothetical protein